MDEHGVAAALLPLVTAFCRVGTRSTARAGRALSQQAGGRAAAPCHRVPG